MYKLLVAAASILYTVDAHIRLTWPPARAIPLDFIDNVRTKPPCGVSKSESGITTNLVAGSSLNVTWFMAYPHKGKFNIELWDNELIADLTPHGGEEDPTQQKAQITLPAKECKNCFIRLLRQASEWGPNYIFWSCSDVNILEDSEANCVGGTFTDGKCVCNPLYSGPYCQYKDDCGEDADCGTAGRCKTISDVTYPKKVCFCQRGYFGRFCEKESTLAEKSYDPSLYRSKNVRGENKILWRKIEDSGEIEVVLHFPGTTWAAVGFRPKNISPSCKSSLGEASDKSGQDKAGSSEPSPYEDLGPPISPTAEKKPSGEALASAEKEPQGEILSSAEKRQTSADLADKPLGENPPSAEKKPSGEVVSSADKKTSGEVLPSAENASTSEVLPSAEKRPTGDILASAEKTSSAELLPSGEDKPSRDDASSVKNEPHGEVLTSAENKPSGDVLPSAEGALVGDIGPIQGKPSGEVLPSAEGASIGDIGPIQGKPSGEVLPSAEGASIGDIGPIQGEPSGEVLPSAEGASIGDIGPIQGKPSGEIVPAAEKNLSAEVLASAERYLPSNESSSAENIQPSDTAVAAEKKPTGEILSAAAARRPPGDILPSAETSPTADKRALVETPSAAEKGAAAELQPSAEKGASSEPHPDAEKSASAETVPQGENPSVAVGSSSEAETSQKHKGDPEPDPEGEGVQGRLHEMDCQDIIIGSAIGDLSRVADYYTRDRSTPLYDDVYGGQDDLTSATGWIDTTNNSTVIMFRRKLQGTDKFDHSIAGRMEVIWAKGQAKGSYSHSPPSGLESENALRKDYYEPHLPRYHGKASQNRGHFTVDFDETGDPVALSSEISSSEQVDNESEKSEPEPEKTSSSEEKPVEGEEDYDGICKGKFTSEDQSYELHWDALSSPGNLSFHLRLWSLKPDSWSGVGLSPDGYMANSDIILVIMKDNWRVTDRFSEGYSRPKIDTQQDVFNVSFYAVLDGVSGARFDRPLSTTDDEDDIDLAKVCVYLLFPTNGGSVREDGSIGKHWETPIAYPEKICFADCLKKVDEPIPVAELTVDDAPVEQTECSKLPVQQNCTDGSSPRWATRWYREEGGNECNVYVHSICGDIDNTLATEEDCYKHCFDESERSALLKDARFSGGFRVRAARKKIQ